MPHHDVTVTAPDPDQLVLDNLGLVHHAVNLVATRYPRHVDRDELWNAGALGLVDASRRFDPDQGTPFQRYAMIRIRGAIIDSTRCAATSVPAASASMSPIVSLRRRRLPATSIRVAWPRKLVWRTRPETTLSPSDAAAPSTNVAAPGEIVLTMGAKVPARLAGSGFTLALPDPIFPRLEPVVES